MTCERCGYEIRVGDFPFCKGQAADHVGGHYGVIPDDLPGGVLIAHGLCHPDGTPRRFDSKSAIEKAAKVAGLMPFVRHTDNDEHVSRWI